MPRESVVPPRRPRNRVSVDDNNFREVDKRDNRFAVDSDVEMYTSDEDTRRKREWLNERSEKRSNMYYYLISLYLLIYLISTRNKWYYLMVIF